MDDILKRFGNLEISVSELKSQVSSMVGGIPHLATKADVAELRTSVGAEMAELRTSVGAIEAIIPQLATKADVTELRASVEAIEAIIPQLATKADVAVIPLLATKAEVAVIPLLATKADLSSLETAIIKWIIATTLASASLAFAMAKFVH